MRELNPEPSGEARMQDARNIKGIQTLQVASSRSSARPAPPECSKCGGPTWSAYFISHQCWLCYQITGQVNRLRRIAGPEWWNEQRATEYIEIRKLRRTQRSLAGLVSKLKVTIRGD